MNRLARIIENLDRTDLELIKKDIDAGNVDRLIAKRLADLQPSKTCPTCGSDMPPSQQKFSLEFGSQGLRQRATFDELDCLEYFIEKLKAPSAEANK